MPENAERIDVDTARSRVESGNTLLVCAYDDDEKYQKMALEGSIPLSEFRSRDVGEDREIVFYCA